MTLLTLTTSQEQEGIRVALRGELDLSSALVFDEELKRIEAGGDADTLILDLHELKFMDSTGLRLILSAHARARKCGRRLRIVLANRAMRRIFQLTGMLDRLDIVDDGAAAPAPAATKPR